MKSEKGCSTEGKKDAIGVNRQEQLLAAKIAACDIILPVEYKTEEQGFLGKEGEWNHFARYIVRHRRTWLR